MLRLDPNAFVAYNLRGVVRYRQKEYQLAIEDFNRYMKYDSLDSRLYFNRENAIDSTISICLPALTMWPFGEVSGTWMEIRSCRILTNS